MDGRQLGHQLSAEVDAVIERDQETGHRKHLGISVIGDECARAVWYHFRWFKRSRHIGRILRLFKRGHREEAVIVEWLQGIGAIVQAVNPDTGKQWLVSDFGGHYGGSCDGKIANLERFGLMGWGLLECKTHNDKSFTHLKKHGLISSKLEHYIQCQEYMYYFGLPWAVYVAVNKNDDELYIEVIMAKPEIGEAYRKRAWDVISNPAPPPRISQNSSWWVCKMCDYHEVCHHRDKAVPDKNCRSCLNSIPDTANGTWYCDHWKATIPDNVIKEGCEIWTPRA